jgi:hypothetical protein
LREAGVPGLCKADHREERVMQKKNFKNFNKSSLRLWLNIK